MIGNEEEDGLTGTNPRGSGQASIMLGEAMDDLVAAIRAAIDEDERLATITAEFEAADDGEVVPSGGPQGYPDLHYSRHDPARVLRQVAAHRKLLAMHSPGAEQPDPDGENGDTWRRCEGHEWVSWPCPEFRALAEGYGIEVPATAR